MDVSDANNLQFIPVYVIKCHTKFVWNMWPVLDPLLIQSPDVYPFIEDAMPLTNSWEYVS